ncbi:MAG: hypothetical protein GY795_19590 [Desulfobacterales bacterium]|nr:hypothetical protein [Desulfobacterales bacterium]
METLFATEGEMMKSQLWEDMRKLNLELIKSKIVTIPKTQRTATNTWTHPDFLGHCRTLFTNPQSRNVSR